MPYILVYGTLMRGNLNEGYLKGQEYIGEAVTLAEDFILVSMTLQSGMSHEFPGAVPGQDEHKYSNVVYGELYRVSNECLRILDMHEGCMTNDPRKPRPFGYYRIRTSVKLMNGLTINDKSVVNDVEIYVMSRSRAMDGIRRGGSFVKNGKWTEPDRNKTIRADRERARHERTRLDAIRTAHKRSLMHQPSPLALMRARKRFQGVL